MDERFDRRVLDELGGLRRRSLTRNIGIVTDVDPLTIELGGVEHTGLPTLGYTPVLGDRVWVSRSERDLVVHSAIFEDTPSGGLVRANANLALTTTIQDVPGCTLTVDEAGIYDVFGSFYFNHTTTGFIFAAGTLDVGGAAATGSALYGPTAANGYMNVAQSWRQTVAAGTTFKLRASKLIAAGVCNCNATNTTMLVEKVR